MSGKFSRTKGAVFEREICKLLQPVVNTVARNNRKEPPQLLRNLVQYQKGGSDIAGLDFLAVECKRCETLQIKSWWRQTIKQVEEGQEPVLIYRQSNEKPHFMINHLGAPVSVTQSFFMNWLECICEKHCEDWKPL